MFGGGVVGRSAPEGLLGSELPTTEFGSICTGNPWPTISTSWMIWQSLKSALLNEAVRAPSRAADEIAAYVYRRRLTSIAPNITARKMGDTSANSTSAWLR